MVTSMEMDQIDVLQTSDGLKTTSNFNVRCTKILGCFDVYKIYETVAAALGMFLTFRKCFATRYNHLTQTD